MSRLTASGFIETTTHAHKYVMFARSISSSEPMSLMTSGLWVWRCCTRAIFFQGGMWNSMASSLDRRACEALFTKSIEWHIARLYCYGQQLCNLKKKKVFTQEEICLGNQRRRYFIVSVHQCGCRDVM